ncbi:hypothetical protein [Halomonas halophila]
MPTITRLADVEAIHGLDDETLKALGLSRHLDDETLKALGLSRHTAR